MITVFKDQPKPSANAAPGSPGSHCIVAQPNQSANWRLNKQILIGIGILSIVIATGFTLVGAWVILPFAGLELLALSYALYRVCRNQNARHVLRFSDQQLIIEKGIDYPQQVWELDRSNTSLLVGRNKHPWDPIDISLCSTDPEGVVKQIPVGDFLNKADSKSLLAELKQQGLMIRSDSSYGHRKL